MSRVFPARCLVSNASRLAHSISGNSRNFVYRNFKVKGKFSGIEILGNKKKVSGKVCVLVFLRWRYSLFGSVVCLPYAVLPFGGRCETVLQVSFVVCVFSWRKFEFQARLYGYFAADYRLVHSLDLLRVLLSSWAENHVHRFVFNPQFSPPLGGSAQFGPRPLAGGEAPPQKCQISKGSAA